jgi:hypothetical protein
MKRILLITVFLAAAFISVSPGLGAQAAETGQRGPIDANLIIDGSRYMRDTGAQAWICDTLLEETLRAGDYLRIWIAADQASLLYQGVLEADNREAVKNLVRGALPLSARADFTGALREARRAAPGNRAPFMTYTLLVSSPGGLSPAHIGEAMPYLRYSRVLEFSGWRALVIAMDIGQQVRDAASSFLSNR